MTDYEITCLDAAVERVLERLAPLADVKHAQAVAQTAWIDASALLEKRDFAESLVEEEIVPAEMPEQMPQPPKAPLCPI